MCRRLDALNRPGDLRRMPVGEATVGTFNVDVVVRNLASPDRARAVSLAVDTGASHTVLPASLVEPLGIEPTGTRRVRLARGAMGLWPVTAVLMRLEGEAPPAVALVGPSDGPALLGAVTLEEFALGVDPVARRLIPLAPATV